MSKEKLVPRTKKCSHKNLQRFLLSRPLSLTSRDKKKEIVTKLIIQIHKRADNTVISALKLINVQRQTFFRHKMTNNETGKVIKLEKKIKKHSNRSLRLGDRMLLRSHPHARPVYLLFSPYFLIRFLERRENTPRIPTTFLVL